MPFSVIAAFSEIRIAPVQACLRTGLEPAAVGYYLGFLIS